MRADLIQDALDAGRIDAVTALVYRAKAVFGLPGLPDEFTAGVPGRDDSVFPEIAELLPSLSEPDQARLRPFLARPTEPGSAFASTAVATAGFGGLAQASTAPWTCRDWANSGSADPRFKVWACRDHDAAAADRDIATISGLLDAIWEPMTEPMDSGMGPPKPDGRGANVSAEYGGDARIDFYALELGQIIYRSGNQSIPVAAAAAAVPSPYDDPSGNATKASSGFVLVNRSRIGQQVKMQQDLIHEFFHVLQGAHNGKAPFSGTTAHWFSEASATWAETFYLRAESAEPHRWFATHFQPSAAGLGDAALDHQYAAYVWPFFMEQEKGESAIFRAWQAIEPVAAGNFAGVTKAISDQLDFTTSFRDFAVRNLNDGRLEAAASLKRYVSLDSHFWADIPPTIVPGGPVVPGEPYLGPPQTIPALAATYFKIDIAEPARDVTISIKQYSGGEVDGDAVVHLLDGRWERRPLVGGVLKFCRDDEKDDIDTMYLVVSNHGRENPSSGFVEASAKDSCTAEPYLAGSITWNVEIPDQSGPGHSLHLTGTATFMLHGDNSGSWIAERGSGSTYSYDATVDNCEPAIHQQGVVESGIGYGDPAWHIGINNASGARPGSDEDLVMNISFNDHQDLTCHEPTPPAWTLQWGAEVVAFPGCEPGLGVVIAKFDGVDSYVVDCAMKSNAIPPGSTGHVQGTLHPVDGPAPSR